MVEAFGNKQQWQRQPSDGMGAEIEKEGIMPKKTYRT
jgi:hypothetical protein